MSNAIDSNFRGANGITQGAAWEFTATFKQAGVVLPIGGATIEMELKRLPTDADNVAVMTTGDDARIVIVGDGSSGAAAYSLPTSVTDLLTVRLWYQQFLTQAGGSRLPAGTGWVDVRAWAP